MKETIKQEMLALVEKQMLENEELELDEMFDILTNEYGISYDMAEEILDEISGQL